jgi:hypothetical protein
MHVVSVNGMSLLIPKLKLNANQKMLSERNDFHVVINTINVVYNTVPGDVSIQKIIINFACSII